MALFECGVSLGDTIKYSTTKTGVAGPSSTVDVSDYPNFGNLTADNFIIEITKISGSGGTAASRTDVPVGVTAYDSSTGVVSVNTGFNVTGQYVVWAPEYKLHIK